MNFIFHSIVGDCILTLDGTRHAFHANCRWTLNGKDCGGGDLRAGDAIEIDGQPAVAVKATRTPVAQAAQAGFGASKPAAHAPVADPTNVPQHSPPVPQGKGRQR